MWLVSSPSTLPTISKLFKDRVSSHPFYAAAAAACSSPSSTNLRFSSSPASIRVRTNARFTFSTTSSPSSCYCSSKLNLMAGKDSLPPSSAAPVSAADNSKNDNSKDDNDLRHSRTFLDIGSEQDLLSAIKKEVESGRLPATVASGMDELYQNYRDAVLQSGIPNADDVVLTNMSIALDRILSDVEEPFEFSPHHKAIREPFDYYMFGQNYIRPLINFRNSYVGNIGLFFEMEERLQQGHNIVLISNHQTEADPAVIALLLEKSNSHIAENTIYVAGDRVITDPLSKPFSMGRNLLCVYSKKHMHDVPELVDKKRRANTRSLKEMALLLRGGSQIIWIAPSGGRDRPDPTTNKWYPAPFDASAVDNMRRLVEHAGVPGHVYPLALLCHDIMPPPPKVEKEIGERRVISFHGAGLSVAPEINYKDIAAACENDEKAKMVYTQALYDSIHDQYEVLKTAIHGKRGLSASNPSVSLSQPWT